MMTYETWRISYQNSEQAARAAYDEMCRVLVENAELKPDAMRYRWLRENFNNNWGGPYFRKSIGGNFCLKQYGELDAAIDKAVLAAAPKQQENLK